MTTPTPPMIPAAPGAASPPRSPAPPPPLPDCPAARHDPRSVNIGQLAACARDASRVLAQLPTGVKNAVLERLAALLEAGTAEILAANRADVEAAAAAGLPAPKLQRLGLTDRSIAALAGGLRKVAALPDPVGVVTRDATVESGLRVRKLRAPLGVIAMIYEARPGVTVDAFALCFKAGNACILRGGKEAERSNAILAALAHRALDEHGAPPEALVNISGTGRDVLAELLELDTLIDLVIPRGGPELIALVRRTSRIPTVQHDRGVCHIYVDESADVAKAVEVCATAKTSAPAACNAVECLLVHRSVAAAFVPAMLARSARDGVEVRATPLVLALAPPTPPPQDTAATSESASAADAPADSRLTPPHSLLTPATPADFGAEFLGPVVAMRTVDSVDEAIGHIAEYGSGHTEAILTGPAGLAPGAAADRFVAAVRASCVLVNASTRFNDGHQLGLGAEIGISTSRVHAYGPMGLEELTTQRWVVVGDGHAR